MLRLLTILALASVIPAFAGNAFYEHFQIIEEPEGISGEFGSKLAFGDGTLIVGDPDQRFTDGELSFDGAAFAYRFSGGAWVLEETFRGEGLREMGQAVAISGNIAVIAAATRSVAVEITLPSGEVVPGIRRIAGEVLAYTRAGDGTWGAPELLRPAESEDAVFGTSVAIEGDIVAFNIREISSEAWKVVLFERVGGRWVETQRLEDPEDRRGGLGGGRGSDRAGLAFAGGDTLVVGSTYFGNERADVFVRGGGGVWEFQQELVPAEEQQSKQDFGDVIAASQDLVAVADSRADEAYVFRRQLNGTWAEGVRLPVERGDSFGSSLAIVGDCVAVGAPFEDSVGALNNRNEGDDSLSGAGAVYLFNPDGSGDGWEQVQFLKSTTNGNAGTAVAIDEDSGTIFLGGESDVFVQVPGSERAFTELEVTVFSPDEDSPISGPAVFGFAEPFAINLGRFSVATTETTFVLETTRDGRFDEGECACVRVRDVLGRLPAILGVRLVEKSGIPDLTEAHISFSEDEITVNPAGLAFTGGRVVVEIDIAPSVAAPRMTSVERFAGGLRVEFEGSEGITEWQFTGGAGLGSFSAEGISVQNFAELSPGNYRADLQISGDPERFFLRVGE